MKLTLNDVTNINGLSVINDNFDKIEQELQNKLLYRENPVGEPNAMQNTLDMNGQRIINLPEPISDNEPARLQDVQNAITGATQANLISFTPTGDITSTTVQAAIEEVDAELHSAIATSLADLANTSDVLKGDALVGVKQSLTGSIGRTQHDKNMDVVSVLDFAGVDPTGVTDSTAGLQAAITAFPTSGRKKLVITSGTYKITNALNVYTKSFIEFEPNVIIDASGLPNETTSAFSIGSWSDITLIGNGAVIKGARATANPVIEGNSAGFFLYGTHSVLIQDFVIQDFATDGITVTGDNAAAGPCVNVRIVGCTCNNNRRNGLSIIAAEGVLVLGGLYQNSNGAPSGPWAGIDVEPNGNTVTRAVTIIGARTRSNIGGGIIVVPGLQGASATGSQFDVTIKGWHSYRDGRYVGANLSVGALAFGGGNPTNKVFGQITVDSSTIVQPGASGVGWSNWDADKAPRVILRDVHVIDPDHSLTAPGAQQRVGFLIYLDSSQSITTCGNIVMENCVAEDTRGVARMTNGFWLGLDGGKIMKDVRIRNPKSINQTDTAGYDVNCQNAIGGTSSNNVRVSYDTPTLAALIGTGAIGAWNGKRIGASTAGSVFTLPSLARSVGATYEVYVPSPVGACSVAAAGGENIKFWGVVAAPTLAVASGDCVRLWNSGIGHWVASSAS